MRGGPATAAAAHAVAPAAEWLEMAAGSTVCIGGQLLSITGPLGMGSFGVVWAARRCRCGEAPAAEDEAAVKEIPCQSETELSRASYEAQLLYLLSASEVDAQARAVLPGVRIPAYIAAEALLDPIAGPGACRVRLAMSRIPGEPLDRFLQERRRGLKASCQASPEGIREGERAQSVAAACRYARALVAQLAPTIEIVATFAYHRDVNAHNILISGGSAPLEEPRYGLVDFGLAVDASRWRDASEENPQGRSEWEYLDVGGDCRYWPASAWLQFQVGCAQLAESPAFCLEYQTHLDLQGLGITALQTFAELMPPRPTAGGSDGVAVELWRLLGAWEEYWETASHFWAALLETFRSGGDWNALKNEFIALGVHDIISRKLQAVRGALVNAEIASRQAPSPAPGLGGIGAAGLFAALLAMISSGEDRGGPTSWEEVRLCLGTDTDGETKPQPARYIACSGTTSSVSVGLSSSRSTSAASSAAVRREASATALLMPVPADLARTPAAPLASTALAPVSVAIVPEPAATALELAPAPNQPPPATQPLAPEPAATTKAQAPVAAALRREELLRRLSSLVTKARELACDMEQLERSDDARTAAAAAAESAWPWVAAAPEQAVVA